MRTYWQKDREISALTILCMVSCLCSGCAWVGPSSIRAGRLDYSEAINKTEDEQMLLSIVKERYGETYTLLAVSSVTASVRFNANAGLELGFGPERNYEGELTPFGGGVAYEENPTISYAPLHGENYVRQLMSPIPLEILVLFVRNKLGSAPLLTMLANGINTMRNPDFRDPRSEQLYPRFQRFVELGIRLQHAHVLTWVGDATKKGSFHVLISGYAPDHLETVREYLTLLGISMPAHESKDILLPVYPGLKGKELNGLAILTRSTFDLIQIFGGAIEIPREHAEAGIALPTPPVGPAGKNIRIHSSRHKPRGATVAVKYRGYWFYIDEADAHTKLFYVMVRMLWLMSISSAEDLEGAPLLTIPVG